MRRSPRQCLRESGWRTRAAMYVFLPFFDVRTLRSRGILLVVTAVVPGCTTRALLSHFRRRRQRSCAWLPRWHGPYGAAGVPLHGPGPPNYSARDPFPLIWLATEGLPLLGTYIHTYARPTKAPYHSTVSLSVASIATSPHSPIHADPPLLFMRGGGWTVTTPQAPQPWHPGAPPPVVAAAAGHSPLPACCYRPTRGRPCPPPPSAQSAATRRHARGGWRQRGRCRLHRHLRRRHRLRDRPRHRRCRPPRPLAGMVAAAGGAAVPSRPPQAPARRIAPPPPRRPPHPRRWCPPKGRRRRHERRCRRYRSWAAAAAKAQTVAPAATACGEGWWSWANGRCSHRCGCCRRRHHPPRHLHPLLSRLRAGARR